MTKEKIIKEVAEIHNLITSIPVHGDETIVMAQAILKARDLVQELQDAEIEESSEEE